MNLSLKKRKPIVYISMGIYLLLSTFIVVESCLPGDSSGIRSKFFTDIIAWFINKVSPPIVPNAIDPNSIELIEDTSVLGSVDSVSNIAIGTTSRITFKVGYPSKSKSEDIYNYQYEIDKSFGDINDYTVNLSSTSNENSLNIYLRVTANVLKDNATPYQIDIKLPNGISYPYKFHIVDKPAPTSYECRIDKSTIKIDESIKISTKLTGNVNGDTYLRRYYDESKLTRSSSNPSVASIDSNGVIHGLSSGASTITYGKETFNITVTNEHSYLPSGNSIEFSKSDNHLSLLDYDYVFDLDGDSDNYSVLVYPSFSNPLIEDKGFSYSIDNDMRAMLAPHHYDEDGYPIYKDNDNKDCVRVCGYREKGDVNLTIRSNSDTSLSKVVTLNVSEALPTSMTLNVSDTISTWVNETKTISATFNPKNVSDQRIHLEVSDPTKIDVSNNDNSSVLIRGKEVGKFRVTVSSVANPSLVKEFEIEFKAKEVINPSNYSDFHKLIRKSLGHFLLFLVTAIFGFIFFYTFINDKKKLWLVLLFSFGAGLFIAGLSEFIQYFIPSRGGVFSDVLIDMLGYLSGMIITLAIYSSVWLIKYLIKRDKNVKNT